MGEQQRLPLILKRNEGFFIYNSECSHEGNVGSMFFAYPLFLRYVRNSQNVNELTEFLANYSKDKI